MKGKMSALDFIHLNSATMKRRAVRNFPTMLCFDFRSMPLMVVKVGGWERRRFFSESLMIAFYRKNRKKDLIR